MSGGERTAAEREAAAAERARRRAAASASGEPPVVREPDPEPAPDPEPEPAPLPPRATPVTRPAPPRKPPASPRQAPPLSHPPRRRDLPPAARGGSRVGRRVLAGVVVVIVGVAVFLAVKVFQPLHGDAAGVVRVKIPAGASVGEIADLLEAREVIASGTFFSLNATLTGRRGGLRPGTYTLQRDMRYGTVLDSLSKGPQAKVIETFKLTLPEGLSAAELAPRVKQGGVSGDYVAATKAATALRRAHALGLPNDQKTTEGFLFPATYDLPKGAEASNLVEDQLKAFAANFRGVDLRRAKRGNLTRYDVVTIASMVEREAQLDRERPLVAAVIYNRLRDGMPLAIDATIRYYENNWRDPLKQSELGRDEPYNTRLNRGLPPTPIGNPGLASLKAAAQPAKVPYLYYVVKPGTCGRHNFSSTDAQFQRDVAAYNAARDRAGGKSPTTC
ncbi:MAG: hypothetical protein QOI80_1554 [Solirubrobacteraceae bacterium]|nr:hypothetical protein [Solirubrobacteraceae bacterium]